MTPRQLIQLAAERFDASDLFYGHGTGNAFDEGVFMVLRSLELPFDVDEEILDQPLVTEQVRHIQARIEERVTTRKPAAYILGEAWFAGLPFFVDESVLVPRSPIAELILDGFAPWCEPDKVSNILDIGTGSGCIAIACAKVFPGVHVDAVDISPAALAVAAKNVDRHGVGEQVSLIRSDLFTAVNKQYDLIIANPPYVDDEDMTSLPMEYRHEPRLGLYAGHDGLDITRRILQQAPDFMTNEGLLFVEVGNSQHAMAEAYPHLPLTWLDFECGGDGVFMIDRDGLMNQKR